MGWQSFVSPPDPPAEVSADVPAVVSPPSSLSLPQAANTRPPATMMPINGRKAERMAPPGLLDVFSTTPGV